MASKIRAPVFQFTYDSTSCPTVSRRMTVSDGSHMYRFECFVVGEVAKPMVVRCLSNALCSDHHTYAMIRTQS
jgi:hypothetical protein